ncbi:hypothetical protein [Halobacteriovorax sp. DPLXC-1]|uniref:hypothetical protein n=1 Tax=unclassified Halobacteriovorax TaxID=2639665 RepID=UPI002FF0A9C4
MGIKLNIQHSEFEEIENLNLHSPNQNIAIGDELQKASDIFISRYDTLINLKYLVDNGANHIIANSPSLKDEIKSVVDFINDERKNNLESRIAPKVQNKVIIESEDGFDKSLQQLLQDIDFDGYHESISSKLNLVTNEFYTNDIFHRTSTQKKGEIRVSQDDCKIIIHYKSYTKVKKSSIVSSLYRAAKEKKPRQEGRGAGLGLYFILQNCDRLQVVQNPESTDFYVYIEKNKRYKDISKRIPSINLYNLKE